MLTTDKNNPKLKEGQKNETGQHEIYLVLSEEERAKGFIRPVRQSYIHIGKKVKKVEDYGILFTLEELHTNNPKEYDIERIKKFKEDDKYVAYIEYSEEYKQKSDNPAVVGIFLKQKECDAIKDNKSHIGGCNTKTTMGLALSETYARNPKFYGATFCCGCNKHLPVDEFVWSNTNEIVGS